MVDADTFNDGKKKTMKRISSKGQSIFMFGALFAYNK